MQPEMDEMEQILENEDGSAVVIDLELEAEAEDSDFYENLAEKIPDSDLKKMAASYLERIERDKEARKRRDEQYEDGLRRSGLGNDAPGGAQFDGASRVVHPLLAESCVDFAARAIKELFPPTGPVKTAIISENVSPADEDRADRKRLYMNWQFTRQIAEYRGELEQLLTQLPLGGSQFMIVRYDDSLDRPVAEFIPIDDIYIPFSASSFYTSPRVCRVLHLTEYEFTKRVKSGMYVDPALKSTGDYPERSASATANDRIEGKDEEGYNEDGLRDVYEIYAWDTVDVDSTAKGEDAPYVISIDAYSEQVLAIYRNWAEGDDDRRKLDWIVEWKFIPWRGAYGVGLPHLIGGLSAAATGALRALLDAAHINNAPSLLKMRSGRFTGSTTQVDVTQITEIELPTGVDDIRKSIMPMPFNQPSPVLFQLLEWITGAAKGVVATADERLNQVGDRTPVGTTMAMIEQGSHTYSAIHARLHESQAKVMEILARINSTFLEDEEVVEDLGSLLIRREEFLSTADVIPVSDPAIFSEAQRMAQMQGVLQLATQLPMVQMNMVEISRRVLKLMRVDNIDEIVKPLPKPFSGDPLQELVSALGNPEKPGTPLRALPQQDHVAHIQAHLSVLLDPMLQNTVPPPVIGMLMGHVMEHVNVFVSATADQLKPMVVQQVLATGEEPTEDIVSSAALQQAQQLVQKHLEPFAPMMQKAQQFAQSKQPPPQLPPPEQAKVQIEQMRTQSAGQRAQMEMQAKQAEMQASQQQAQAKMQMEAQSAQMEAQMAQARLQMEQQKLQSEMQLRQAELQLKQQELMQIGPQMEQLKQDIELQKARMVAEIKAASEQAKNQMDNEQHHATELRKNTEDNQTQLLIAQMKAEQDAALQGAKMVSDVEQKELDREASMVNQDMDRQAQMEDNAAQRHADLAAAAFERIMSPPEDKGSKNES